MTSHGAFPTEEFGSGSRPTPLFEAPAWMKAHGQPPGERITLTALDQAFLESPPTYEECGSLLPPEPVPLPTPSRSRRVLPLLLFTVIGGSALAVLTLALARALGHSIFGW
jgi:hypothetical protein